MSDRKPSPAPESPPQQPPETMETQVKEESPRLISPTISAPPNSGGSLSPQSRHSRTTPAQRRASLRDDPLAGELEPRRVYCRKCSKWIKLSTSQEYNLSNWRAHTLRVHGPPESPQPLRRTPSKPNFSPSSRVATTERHIVLLNDSQVKSFGTSHVHCGACKTMVALEGGVDYDLTRWTEHKETCIPKTPAPITPQPSRAFAPHSASSTQPAGGSARSSTSVGEGQSTDATAVPEGSAPAVKIGVKRGRDEDDVAEEQRPTVRPRPAPPEEDGVGLMGWLAHPFKEFARGFRQGLAV